MKATGGCLCGAVRYEIDGEPIFSAHCHCRDCQKATGAGHASVLGMPGSAVRLTGETRAYSVKGDSGQSVARHFCPVCGSVVFSAPEILPGATNILAGTLDDPSVFKPQIAIYTRDRAPWDRIDAALMEFETVPPRPGG